jgi:replicative DNA helicase
MKLSAPIFRLKREARLMARAEGLKLHEAQARIARREGFAGWSLLMARARADRPAGALLRELGEGELVLLAARPGEGKTLLALGLTAEAIAAGRCAHVFSLEETEVALRRRYDKMGGGNGPLVLDTSDGIDAAHIVARLTGAAPGTLAVVDYMQILDQRRDSPVLNDQIATLARFARLSGIMLVCLSQIDRQFEESGRRLPGLADLRLPNPVDLTHFAKACFLGGGEIEITRI